LRLVAVRVGALGADGGGCGGGGGGGRVRVEEVRGAGGLGGNDGGFATADGFVVEEDLLEWATISVASSGQE
jgi:hypothetical protein